jgi:type II secretory pathway predicted ATPase ExeA
MTASSGAIMEFYRQMIHELDIHIKTNSKAMMLRIIKKEISALVCEKKIKVLLLVDEASLLRLEVFAELHTICQFEKDSKPYLPIILAGQNNLIDKLSYRSSQPLASRVVARSHLQGTNLAGMQDYLKHHLAVAGIKHTLFDQNAITAIQQASGGLFRKANHLARGALIAAAANQAAQVNAEHVRLAATEIF